MKSKSSSATDTPLPRCAGEIVEFFAANQKFAVTGHARPDGDSLGSALGLAQALGSLGKQADVFNSDPHPPPYHFLPGIENVRVSDRIEGEYDALVLLECNDLDRPGLQGLDRYYTVNIDHHPKTGFYGDLNWVDPSAAAVGELVYELVLEMGVTLTPAMSTNLYVALFTDTGSFQYSNTRAETFLIAGDLIQHGADPAAIARSLHMNQPRSRIQLLGLLLETLDVHPSGKIASISLTREMLRKTGAAPNDTEGIVNYPLSIEGVEVAAFFREEQDQGCRVSLRSKSLRDVSAVAELFGGGGHKSAAGLFLETSLAEAKETITGELEKLFQSDTRQSSK